jgi:putative hemolysin
MFESVIIFCLILLNAFFALSEMAIVSSSKPLLKEYAKQGSAPAKKALSLAENAGRFLSTVQVGITLGGILAGAYGGAALSDDLVLFFNQYPFISPYEDVIAVFIVVSCITFFSVVLGELLPKQFALSNPEKIAMHVAGPMMMISKMATPLVLLLENSAAFLTRILGLEIKDDAMTTTEIKAVIAEGVESGAIEDEEHDVIKRVIRLGDREVKSIMTHRRDVVFIDIADRLDEIREKIATAGHSRYPVIDKDSAKVMGIIKTKSMITLSEHQGPFDLKPYVQDVYFMNENMSCLEALNVFRTENIHVAAVIDEYGAFEGLVTVSDLLEAIVGVMPSNYDDQPLIVERPDGSYLVDGMTAIEEIRILLNFDDMAMDGDYQTLAGFMLSELKSTPQVAMSFVYRDYRFEIVDMDRRRIDKILIQKITV